MAGTKSGGQKAAETNKQKYGLEFYRNIGRIGGHNGHTGGFAANPELAKIAGARGGRKSKRGKGNRSWEEREAHTSCKTETIENKIKETYKSLADIHKARFEVREWNDYENQGAD